MQQRQIESPSTQQAETAMALALEESRGVPIRQTAPVTVFEVHHAQNRCLACPRPAYKKSQSISHLQAQDITQKNTPEYHTV